MISNTTFGSIMAIVTEKKRLKLIYFQQYFYKQYLEAIFNGHYHHAGV